MRLVDDMGYSYLSVTGSNPMELSASATIWGIVAWADPMTGAYRRLEAGVSNWVYAVAVPA